MKTIGAKKWIAGAMCCCLCSAGWSGDPQSAATSSHGVVATVHPLASQAGLEAMRRGGNAIDAAVAAALTLGVVDGHNSGIGGGCFFLVRLADGTVAALDGRETAPAAASRDMFVREGRADPALSQVGALAVGVPGSLKVYEHAVRTWGRGSLAEHLKLAADLAERGFAVNAGFARRLADSAELLRQFPEAARVYLREGQEPYREGEILRQPDLARSYRAVADQGAVWFYEGAFARATDRWMREHDGLMTSADLQAYQWKMREPIRSTYRGFEIVGFPPPSSGGVHVAQILHILDHFDLKAMNPRGAEWVHVVAEAMKLAFADRAYWLGDPDFAPVPRGLVDPSYGRELAGRIDLGRASEVKGHGTPEHARQNVFDKHTTHFSTADGEGNWVACTATVNLSFGSKVVIPGTGIVMNNQMDDFSIQPGVPNAFGLVGAEANAVAPGKRPLSSMSPTMVLRDGRPWFSVGAAGGPTIISQVILALVRVIDFEMSLEEALAAPRFHHQWRPNELVLESAWPVSVVESLESKGHRVSRRGGLGVSQGVYWKAEPAGFGGAADPRAEGVAVVR